jgi:ankyrin repeat protein
MKYSNSDYIYLFFVYCGLWKLYHSVGLTTKGFELSCKNGYLQYAQWFAKKGANCENFQLFKTCCKRGHYDVVVWLTEIGSYDDKDSQLFKTCCKRGHYDVVVWLSGLGFRDTNGEGFRQSCKRGHFEIVKWLCSYTVVNINYSFDLAFRYCCEYGHLEIAQYLYKLKVDIHAKSDEAFRLSCKHGHIHIARWLQKLGANVRANEDEAFRWSCEYGHSDVAMLLYTLGANIRASNDYALLRSYRNGHYDLARTLIEMSPKMWFDCRYKLFSMLPGGLPKPHHVYEKMKIPHKTIDILYDIVYGRRINNLKHVDNIIIRSLYYNNKIDELVRIRDYAGNFTFDIVGGTVSNLIFY